MNDKLLAQRSKATQYSLIVLLGIDIIFLAIFFILGRNESSWQLTALMGVSAVTLLGHFVTLILLHRLDIKIIVTVATVFFYLPVLVATFLLQGGSLFLITALTILSIIVAINALGAPQTRSFIQLNFLIGLLMLFVELWMQNRFFVPRYTIFVNIVALAIIVACAVLVFNQFQSYLIQTKLTLSSSLITVLITVIFTLVTATSTINTLLEQNNVELQSTADLQAASIEDNLTTQVSILQTLALNSTLQGLLEEINREYAGTNGDIEQYLEELDGRWLSASEEDAFVQAYLDNAIVDELAAFQTSFPAHAEIFVTDRYGGLAGAIEPTSDFFQADEGWWQAAFSNGGGDVFISQPELDESAGITGMQFAVPIFSQATNEIVGVLRTTFDLNEIAPKFSNNQNTPTRIEIHIPNNLEIEPEFDNGKVQFVVEEVDDEFSAVLSSMLETPESLSLESDPSLFNLLENQLNIDGVLSFANLKPIRSASAIPAIERLNWVVLVAQTSEDVLSATVSQQRSLGLLSILLTGLAGFAVFYITRLITTPILELADSATQFAEGNLSVRSKLNTDDEVGVLGSTFNQMAGQLQTTLSNLEQRVFARTFELSSAVNIGQQIIKIRDVNTLLQETVNLIQEQFDLYYTQILLVDPLGTTLEVKAGSGLEGQKIQSRKLALPIGSGSINGSVAATRQPIVVSDVRQSSSFSQNFDLPLTQSEVSIPLVSGDRLLGVLNMQSQEKGKLSEELLPAFTAIANQVAIAIDNASLFTETEKARLLIEEQAKRLTRDGWNEYFDGIEREESTGYAYMDNQLVPLTPSTRPNGQFANIPITAFKTTIGSIQIDQGDNHKWTKAELELIDTVSKQVAQQSENLRLLSQAEQYRQEAENVTKRLVRDGWQAFEKQNKHKLAVAYDQNKVFETNQWQGTADFIKPLAIRNEPIGEILIDGLSFVDEKSQQFIGTIAEQLSNHLENLRLAEQRETALAETETQAYRLTLLNEMSAELADASTLEAIYKITTTKTNKMLANDRISIALGNVSEGQFELFGLDGEKGQIPLGTFIPLTNTLIGKAVRLGKVTVENDVENSETHDAKLLARSGIKSIMNAPIRRGNEIVGTLNIASKIPSAYGQADVNLFRQIATIMSAILENKNLLEQTKNALADTENQARRLALLNKMSGELANAGNLQEIYKITTSQTRLIIANDRTSLALGDVTAGHFEVFALDGEQGRIPLGQIVPLSQTLVGEAVSQKRVIVSNDLTDSKYLDAQNLAQSGIRSIMNAPLLRGQVVFGTLNIASEKANAFSDQDVNLFQQIALLLSGTVENERLLRQTQARAAQLNTVAQVSTAASTNLDPNSLLQTVVDLTKAQFGLYHAHIYVLEGDELILRAGSGEVGKTMVAQGRKLSLNNPRSLVARAARTREGVLVNDVKQASDALQNPLLPDTHSGLSVPLIAGKELLGVLNVQADYVNAFSEEDILTQTTLASQVAIALQNARLYADTQRRAQRERLVNDISRKIQSTVSIEDALQMAVRELGTALKSKQTHVELSITDNKTTNGVMG